MKKIAYILLASLIIAIIIPNISLFVLKKLCTPESPIVGFGQLLGGLTFGLLSMPWLLGPVSVWYRDSVMPDNTFIVQVPLSASILDLLIWFTIIFVIVNLHEKRML